MHRCTLRLMRMIFPVRTVMQLLSNQARQKEENGTLCQLQWDQGEGRKGELVLLVASEGCVELRT